MAQPSRFPLAGFLAALTLSVTLIALTVQAGEELDQPMYRMPLPENQTVHRDFQDGLAEIWIRALQQDKQELKRNAADALTLAHRMGYKTARQAAPELLAQYQQASHSHAVHVALARALAELDVREAQPLFEAEMETDSSDLAFAIELALARWSSKVANDAWLKRLELPRLDKTITLRAIGHLVSINDKTAIAPLQTIVGSDSRPASVRLGAAKALAQLSSDFEDFVRPWVNTESPRLERLLAATTLSTHTSADAIELLLKLGRDPEPTVAVIACLQLESIDIKLLYDDLDTLSRRRDPELRRVAVRGLTDRASAADTRRLLELLDDLHPVVRHDARVSLESLADDASLRPIILTTVTEFLANRREADDWRLLEQSAVLVGNLDHEEPSESLFELLDFKRDEVAIAAAWSISRLAIPETFPRIVAFATKIADDLDQVDFSIDNLHEKQLTHLFQGLGLADYKPAKPILARFVPKRMFKFGMEGRAAAIWALGFIMNGEVDEELAGAIAGRMLDGASSPAEVLVVRRMSAVALGRMQAESQLPRVRQTVQENGLAVPLGWCAMWSVNQLTGEAIPEIPDRTVFEQGWFLTPLPPPRGGDQ